MGVDRRRFLGAMGVGAGLLMTGGTAAAASTTKRVFFGAYTTWNGGAKGIGVGTYDTATGQLEQTGVIPGVVNPSFVIESTDGRFLYAVNETGQGAVTALDAATLQVVNQRPTGGADPCHLTLDPSGQHLITADYSSGSLSVFPVNADGSLGERTQKVQHEGSGPNPDRQEGPHAHHIVFDPSGKYAAAVDLGADSVFFYTFTGGRLEPFSTAKVAPGAGPRHIAFHPDGERAYVANELDSTIVSCAYADGTLTPGQVLKTVPDGTGDNFPAEVLVSADGRYVYLSNRGHDSVARFAVEGAGLSLAGFTPVGGEYPRHITFDPSGKFLFAANQNSSLVTSFAVDAASGELTPSGTPLKTEIPVCVLPTGR